MATISQPPSLEAGLAIREARASDRPSLEALLREAGLPLEGLADAMPAMLVAEAGERLVAGMGFERRGAYGLVRSAVVQPEFRGHGLGRRLLERLVSLARAEGRRTLYLLTTTAAAWFERQGFRPVERSVLPPELHESAELRGACPATATAMALSLQAPAPEESRLDADARELHHALSDLIRAYQFRDRDRVCRHDLTVSECYALEGIAARAQARLSDVCAHLRLDKSTTSRVVDGLVAKGYVRRGRHPVDGRALRLVATASGRRVAAAIEAQVVAEEAALLRPFPRPARQDLIRLVRALQQRAVRPAAACAPQTEARRATDGGGGSSREARCSSVSRPRGRSPNGRPRRKPSS